jgi:hypothetical protein
VSTILAGNNGFDPDAIGQIALLCSISSSRGSNMFRMGFFPNFKGADSVLLAADSEGIQFLLDTIARATANPAEGIPLHEFARVSAEHPASVYIGVNPKAIRFVPANTYYLDVSGNARLNVEGLLQPLADASAGH